MPFGKRPFRVHIDPAQDGAEIVNGVADRVRAEMYHNIGLADLLTPVISNSASEPVETGNTRLSTGSILECDVE